jgi:hypothetical protein
MSLKEKITAKDVLDVAERMFKPATYSQISIREINEVIKKYPDVKSKGIQPTWQLVVEEILYDMFIMAALTPLPPR